MVITHLKKEREEDRSMKLIVAKEDVFKLYSFSFLDSFCLFPNIKFLLMENTADWTTVDLLVSQLMDMYDPHEDMETIQKTFSTLNTERDELQHKENTLRDYLKGY